MLNLAFRDKTSASANVCGLLTHLNPRNGVSLFTDCFRKEFSAHLVPFGGDLIEIRFAIHLAPPYIYELQHAEAAADCCSLSCFDVTCEAPHPQPEVSFFCKSTGSAVPQQDEAAVVGCSPQH
jgi:hypothetical protein